MKTVIVIMFIMQAVILVTGIITLNKIFGIADLLRWELSNFEHIIKTRISAFLEVFRKNRNAEHQANKEKLN